MPRVTTTFFDGPVDITSMEVRDTAGGANAAVAMDQNGDATSRDQITADGRNTQIYLPNGRRTTAHVIENNADGTVATGDGTVINAPNGSTTVGVRFTLLTDAVGHTHVYTPVGIAAPKQPGNYTINSNGDMGQTGLSHMASVTVGHGPYEGPAGWTFSGISSTPGAAYAMTGSAEDSGDGLGNSGGTCACRVVSPSLPTTTATVVNPSTGWNDDHMGGSYFDAHGGIMFSGDKNIFERWWDGVKIIGDRVSNEGVVEAAKQTGAEVKQSAEQGAKILARAVEESASDMATRIGKEIGDNLIRSGRVREGHLIKTMVGYAGTVFGRLGAKVVGELSGLIIAVATELAKMPADRIEEAITGMNEMLHLISALISGEIDWKDLMDDTMREAFKELFVTELTPEEFMDALADPNINCQVAIQRKADAHASLIYVSIIVGATVATAGAASVALFSKLKNGAKLLERLKALLKGGFRRKADATAQNCRVCFVAGTAVWVLREGVDPEEARLAIEQGADPGLYMEQKPIEQIRPGEYVLTRPDDDPTAPLTVRRVTDTTCTTADCIATVTLFDEAGQRPFTIRATEGHPFWVWSTGGDKLALADTGANERHDGLKYRHDAHGNLVRDSQGWVFATDLRGGYELPSFTSASVRVLGVERTPVRRVPVYNFGVAGTRTYFVGDLALAAPVPVWVHNDNHEKKPEGGADKGNFGNLKTKDSGWLKRKGIDAEQLKKDCVGNAGAKYNIAVDEDGNIWLVPVKKDSGIAPQKSGYTLDEAADIYRIE